MLGGICKRYVSIGDKVVVIVKCVVFFFNMKKGIVFKVVVVRIKKEICRKDGFYIRFEENVVVFLNN